MRIDKKVGINVSVWQFYSLIKTIIYNFDNNLIILKISAKELQVIRFVVIKLSLQTYV